MRLAIALLSLCLFSACGNEPLAAFVKREGSTGAIAPIPGSPEDPSDGPPLGAVGWDHPKRNSRPWSLHVFQLILEKRLALLGGARDVEVFCPRFYSLTNDQRAYFWTAFISAFAYYESGWEPTARLIEKSMGIDPVTGQRVVSEGLLQLSYQDRRSHPYCDEFDWNHDRHLDPQDPRKTILDPIKNLSCGVQILNRQIEKYGRILIDGGAYWAVLKPHRKDRINGIQKQLASLKALGPCFQ